MVQVDSGCGGFKWFNKKRRWRDEREGWGSGSIKREGEMREKGEGGDQW